MENQINIYLKEIKTNFPNSQFEIIHNSFSRTLKHFVIKDHVGVKGFGTDHNFQTCIEKAYSEYVERKVFYELNSIFNEFKTSNGFAAHLSYDKSKQSSINELIERDAFLICWHGMKAPYWLSSIEIKKVLSNENLELYSNHLKNNLFLSIGIISKSAEIYTVIVKVSLKDKDYFYIDTKASNNLIKSINDLIEGISFFSHYITLGNFKVKKITRTKIEKPMDHFFYYLTNNHKLKWFHNGNNHIFDIPTLEINTFNINTHDILNKEHLQRVVTFSESKTMQSYYCGNFNIENLNINRFENIFGRNLKFNKLPHPLS